MFNGAKGPELKIYLATEIHAKQQEFLNAIHALAEKYGPSAMILSICFLDADDMVLRTTAAYGEPDDLAQMIPSIVPVVHECMAENRQKGDPDDDFPDEIDEP